MLLQPLNRAQSVRYRFGTQEPSPQVSEERFEAYEAHRKKEHQKQERRISAIRGTLLSGLLMLGGWSSYKLGDSAAADWAHRNEHKVGGLYTMSAEIKGLASLFCAGVPLGLTGLYLKRRKKSSDEQV